MGQIVLHVREPGAANGDNSGGVHAEVELAFLKDGEKVPEQDFEPIGPGDPAAFPFRATSLGTGENPITIEPTVEMPSAAPPGFEASVDPAGPVMLLPGGTFEFNLNVRASSDEHFTPFDVIVKG